MAKKSTIVDFIFGLPFVAVCVPAIIGGGVAVAAINQFSLGYGLFCFAGIWSVGHWVMAAEPVIQRRVLWRTARAWEIKKYQLNYLVWLCVGISICVGMTTLGCWWTRWTQLDFHRSQVSQKLEISYSAPINGDVMDSVFSVRNGSDFSISSRHQITCMVNLVVDQFGGPMVQDILLLQMADDKWVVSNPQRFTPGDKHFSIKAHDDAQTDSCLAAIHGPSIACADIFVDFSYYLTDQPDMQDHRQRIVVKRDRAGNLNWYGQPQESKEDYCYSSLSATGKLQRDATKKNGVSDFSRDDFWNVTLP